VSTTGKASVSISWEMTGGEVAMVVWPLTAPDADALADLLRGHYGSGVNGFFPKDLRVQVEDHPGVIINEG